MSVISKELKKLVEELVPSQEGGKEKKRNNHGHGPW